jgi:hypothetical protein
MLRSGSRYAMVKRYFMGLLPNLRHIYGEEGKRFLERAFEDPLGTRQWRQAWSRGTL